jgi:hypothetical protein
MESFPEMANKVTALVRATGIEDPGRMNDAGTERPDPEVPERVRRRTFTAKYKLEILAAYDAAPAGEKGAGEVELVLPVRDLGHLLPLRSRMDGR